MTWDYLLIHIYVLIYLLIMLFLRVWEYVGLLKHCTSDFNTACLKILYCVLVRLHFEYASCVWSSYYESHKKRMKLIQHKLLRYVGLSLNVSEISVTVLFYFHNLLPLNVCRLQRGLKTFYNLLHDNCSALLERIGIPVLARFTQSTYTFTVPYHHFLNWSASLANHLNTKLHFFTDFSLFNR